MTRFFIVTCFLLFSKISVFASVIYVAVGQDGDGSSWQNAIGDLRTALAIAESGDEVWVAKGTYFPVECAPCTESERAITFNISSGVKLYGGFAGKEISRDERFPLKNSTRLSGNIGYADNFDNSYSIVTFQNVNAETVLDGFTVFGGAANKTTGADGDAGRSGGGIYNIATFSESFPQIRNCLFFENTASEGGAIFNYGAGNTARVGVENCSFLKNTAINAGGAVMDIFRSDIQSASIFSDCKFVKNEAGYGGAYFSEILKIETEIFDNCAFTENKSIYGGAAYFSEFQREGSQVQSMTCSFTGNTAKEGNEFYFKNRENKSTARSNKTNTSL